MARKENNAPLLVLNDDFIQSKAKCKDGQEVDAFRCDYSPKLGKIIRIEPLARFRMISELSLIGHGLENIAPLQGLSALKRLNLSWNGLTSKSVLPLTKIVSLEMLSLSSNAIVEIPRQFGLLVNLRVLKMGMNPIADRRQFEKLKKNVNLTNVDFEGTPVFREEDSVLFCVYTLPQVALLNRNFVSIEMRRKASERWDRQQIEELLEENERLESERDNLAGENERLKKLNEKNASSATGLSSDLEKLREKCEMLERQTKEQEELIRLRDEELVRERNAAADFRAQFFQSSDELMMSRDERGTVVDEKLQQEMMLCKEENAKLRARIEELNGQTEELTTQLEEEKIQHQTVSEESEGLRDKIRELEQQIARLMEENNAKAVTLEENQRVAEAQKLYIDEIETELTALRTNPLNFDIERKSDRVSSERIRTLEERVSKLTMENDILTNEVNKKQEEIDRIFEENKSLRSLGQQENHPEIFSSELSEHSNLEELEALRDQNLKRAMEVQGLQSDLLTAKQLIQQQKTEIERLKQDLSDSRAEQNELEKRNQELETQLDTARAESGKSDDYQEEVFRLQQSLKDYERKFEEVIAERNESERQKDLVIQKLTSQVQDYDQLTDEIEELKQEVQSDKEQIQILQQENEQLRAEIDGNEAREDREEQQRQLASALDDCENAKKVIKAMKQANEKLGADLQTLQDDHERLLVQLGEKDDEIEKLLSERNEFAKQVDGFTKREQELEEEMEQLKEKFERQTSLVGHLHGDDELEMMTAKIEELTSQNESLAQALNAARKSELEGKQYIEESQKLKEEVSALMRNIRP